MLKVQKCKFTLKIRQKLFLRALLSDCRVRNQEYRVIALVTINIVCKMLIVIHEKRAKFTGRRNGESLQFTNSSSIKDTNREKVYLQFIKKLYAVPKFRA